MNCNNENRIVTVEVTMTIADGLLTYSSKNKILTYPQPNSLNHSPNIL